MFGSGNACRRLEVEAGIASPARRCYNEASLWKGIRMIRIKGTVGNLPVDLAIDMDAEDWAHLAGPLATASEALLTSAAAPAPGKANAQDDGAWRSVLHLLEQAGRIDCPALLDQVQGLVGDVAAGKRMLVRLRHCPQVKVEAGADAPVYCWVG